MQDDFFKDQDLNIVAPSDMAALLGAFHDGSLMWPLERVFSGRWEVYCPYLAELVAPSCTCFYLQVKGVQVAVFQPWWREADRAAVTWDLLAAPRGLELEIASAEARGQGVLLHTYSMAADYGGGTLYLELDQVQLYDPMERPMSLKQLQTLVQSYWATFSS